MPMFENIVIRRLKRYLPTWSDPDSTRDFSLRCMPFLEDFSEGTPTKIDDFVVGTLDNALDDAAKWGTIHGLFVDAISNTDTGNALVLSPADSRICLAAAELGLSADVVILILQILLGIRNWFTVDAGSTAT